MPRATRHRTTSYGSLHDHQRYQQATIAPDAVETAQALLSACLALRNRSGKSFLHMQCNLTMAKALLDRAKSLDELNSNNNNNEHLTWQRKCLLQTEIESGYTPFHCAILQGNLAAILLFLRHAQHQNNGDERLAQPPMALLHAASAESSSTSLDNTNKCHLINNESKNAVLIQEMATAMDKEGFTPLELLGRLQRVELSRLRKGLLPSPDIVHYNTNATTSSVFMRRGRRRQSSFDDDQDQQEEELGLLTNNMDILQTLASDDEGTTDCDDNCSYGCEVVAFGRPNHYALGVVSSSNKQGSGNKQDSSAFRPQRVQEFAQDTVGRDGSAVAIAAATHHTLVATKNGHLYAFGLGKGGRLGMGDGQMQQCPLPRRVLGPLARRKVAAVAAAENHSLCVTSDGTLFSWGSNRFGQLGSTSSSAGGSTSTSNSSTGNNFGCLPRRVEDMRNIPCIAVTAGEKHSVALSRRGEVYIWGDNTAGQLGVPRRSGIQKVQRVEALWNSNPPKKAISIAAAQQSTLVLTTPVAGLTRVNSIYSWGHGNHVPIRVHFDNNSSRQESLSSRTRRVINPVAIACAKYHNAAITSEGHVYTWGLHAESLGRSNKPEQRNNASSGRSTSSPQLVSGMLPENGGGFAVALSASDQHTAVVTDCGALFTWGTTYGNSVLGHEGVRWQPSPKRVPGVHRAVNVAVAKEHTVLLIGSTFPSIPPQSGLESLELLAARKVAHHVDLFNVVPILLMAERTQCSILIEYCSDFISRNLDGVMNVGKKSVMDQYLNDMLADSLHHVKEKYRDDRQHPFVTEVITAGNERRPSFDLDWLSSTDKWIVACRELAKSAISQRILSGVFVRKLCKESDAARPTTRNRSLSCESDHDSKDARENPVAQERSLYKLIKKTSNMDLSTSEVAEENSVWLAKEIRGVRKKLNQIKKLQESEASDVLSTEQLAKLDRRPALEAELSVFENALVEVQNRIKELTLREENKRKAKKLSELNSSKEKNASSSPETGKESLENHVNKKSEPTTEEESPREKSFSCEICSVKCPDQTSFELHNSGRKHRNRIAQVAEEEKTKAAASIMEHRQLERVKSIGNLKRAPLSIRKTKNAWEASSTQPKYKLPPPPHPAVPQVSSSRSPWKASASNPSASPTKFATPTKSKSPQTFDFQKVTKKDATKTKVATPKALTPSTESPVCHSSPGSSHCVPLIVHSASTSALSPSAPSGQAQRNSFSLGDFLAPKSSQVAKSPSTKRWSSPQQANAAGAAKTFAQIQEEEADFKARQAKSYEKGGGTWFIERRERADSLREIEDSARKEQEEQQLIEEQKMIEAQIQKELALQRNQKKRDVTKKKRAPPKKKTNKGLNNTSGNASGNNPGRKATGTTPNVENATTDGVVDGVVESQNQTPGNGKQRNRNYKQKAKKGPAQKKSQQQQPGKGGA